MARLDKEKKEKSGVFIPSAGWGVYVNVPLPTHT